MNDEVDLDLLIHAALDAGATVSKAPLGEEGGIFVNGRRLSDSDLEECLRNPKPPTNGDLIRRMNDDELADEYIRIFHELPKYSDSWAWLRAWLKQEVGDRVMLNLEEYNAVFDCNLSKDAFDVIMGTPIKIRDAEELIFVDPNTKEKIVFRRMVSDET